MKRRTSSNMSVAIAICQICSRQVSSTKCYPFRLISWLYRYTYRTYSWVTERKPKSSSGRKDSKSQKSRRRRNVLKVPRYELRSRSLFNQIWFGAIFFAKPLKICERNEKKRTVKCHFVALKGAMPRGAAAAAEEKVSKTHNKKCKLCCQRKPQCAVCHTTQHSRRWHVAKPTKKSISNAEIRVIVALYSTNCVSVT